MKHFSVYSFCETTDIDDRLMFVCNCVFCSAKTGFVLTFVDSLTKLCNV